LLSDEALYRSVSGAARQTAQTRFCTSLIIPHYEQYYKEICSNRG
jgi:hypothetical protein